MKKRKTRTKISAPRWRADLVRRRALALLVLAAAMVPISSGQQASGKKPSKKEAAHAVIAGTVFRDPGFAQPGAAVTLSLKDDPKEKRLQEAVSDNRGEFVFRVLPVQATYVVHATLKGYRPVRQEIEISGEEQVNTTLLLVPESK
jgi:hypothetical protein